MMIIKRLITTSICSAVLSSLLCTCASSNVENTDKRDRISVNNVLHRPVINPLSEDLSKSTFSVNAIPIEGRLDSITGGRLYAISMRVYGESGDLVFHHYEKANITDIPDLFITEDVKVGMKIPKITWSGEENEGVALYPKRKSDGTQIVYDGIYTIVLDLLESVPNENENVKDKILKNKLGQNVMKQQSYQVEVRTEPPKFDFELKEIPNASRNSDSVCSEILFYDRRNALAAKWKINIRDKSGNVFETIEQGDGVRELPFIMTPWNVTNLVGNYTVTATAEDSVGNRSEETVVREISLPIIDAAVMNRRKETDDFIKILTAFAKKESVVHIENGADCFVTMEKPLYMQMNVSSISYSNGGKTYTVKKVVQDGKKIRWNIEPHQFEPGTYQMSVKLPVNGTLADIAVGNVSILDDSKLSVRDKFEISCKRTRQVNVASMSMKEIPVVTSSIKKIADVPCEWSLDVYSANKEKIFHLSDGDSESMPLGTFSEFEWFGERDFSEESDTNWTPIPGELYFVGLTVKDIDGMSDETAFEPFLVGMVYAEVDGGKKVSIPDIIFPANRSDYLDDEELFAHNFQTLKNISDILKENDDDIQKVTIRGFANPTTYPNEKEMNKENRDSLQPLSEKRAVAVRNTLVLLGVQEDKLTAEGRGGLKDTWIVAPDAQNKDKNRRIEFFVE